MSEKNYHRVIGIDLGTTYSAVAVWDRSQEETAVVLPNTEDPNNPNTTPSVVSLHPQTRKVIVGKTAKQNLPADPFNTIVEIKREMGENCREPVEGHPGNLHLYSSRDYYNEQKHQTGQEAIPFHVRFDGKWFRPQEISAFTLMKMKEIAEQAIGEEIINAVITVPAYFTEQQKKATKEAALLAGLYPLKLIAEPTAAAICYGLDKMEETRKVYLIYDLGGGTFDVSIISVEENNLEVIATSGDPRLGGGDFDDLITAWAIQQLQEKHQIDVSSDNQAKLKIKLNAEITKIELSTLNKVKLNLLGIIPSTPLLELERTEFEEKIEPLLDKSISYVEKAIKQAKAKGIGKDDIDAILLVGGSSKIPRVRAKLLDYFQKGEEFIKSDLDPDAVVARGAAIVALRCEPLPGPFNISQKLDNVLVSSEADQVANIRLITEHSLSVGVQGGVVDRILDQGTNIPVSVSKGGYTNPALQTDLICAIFQGEGKFQEQNTQIGILHLGPMEAKPEGFHQFEVTFSLDENGLLTTTVFHRNENKRYQARFDQKTGVPENDMKVTYNKLVQMYSSKSDDNTAIPPPPPGYATSSPSANSVPPTTELSSSIPPSQYSHQGLGSTSTTHTTSGGMSDATAGASVEIPAEFKQIVRRTQDFLSKQADAQLQNGLNTFLAALNQAAGESQLIELGDKLADLFEDARKKPSGPLEPNREIPDQFKQVVRRAQKLLIKSSAPQLLNTLNEFIAALNRGVAEDDLVEFGDNLADAFDEARRSTSN